MSTLNSSVAIPKALLALLLLLCLYFPRAVESVPDLEETEETDEVNEQSGPNQPQSLFGSSAGCSSAAWSPYCPLPKDCTDIQNLGYSKSGVYTVHIGPYNKPVDVYCDQGWLVIQRRNDGFTNFYRGWNEYANGFGDLYGEFWLGNHFINLITQQTNYRLRVYMDTFDEETAIADYTTFKVAGPYLKYTLTVGGYSSGAIPGDSLVYHNGFKFSTYDQDNDIYSSNCASQFKGGWWYGACHKSNLNGKYLAGAHTTYADGIGWSHWKGRYYSMKTSVMMIRPL